MISNIGARIITAALFVSLSLLSGLGYAMVEDFRKISIIDVPDNQDVYDPKIKF